MDKEKNNNKRLWIILAIVVVLLIAVVIILVLVLFNKSKTGNVIEPVQNELENSSGANNGILAYETSAIATDPVTLQQLVDEMTEKAQEGTMALEMRTDATASDGKNFSCYIANAVSNNYDMFFVIYLDETQEEIYRSGLIPLGSRIESFTSNVVIPSGTHIATIVYNQVEDDHATIHSQVNVGLNLIVQ